MIDRRSARRRQTGETGAILPFIALGMISVLLFLIMTVDVGVGYMARGQLQNIADAAARAALEMRTDNGMSPPEAVNAARDFAQRMTAANGLPGAEVIFGDYDFASKTFRPGGMTLNPAVRVIASREAQGRNAIPGLFQDIDVSASATAMFKCRAIVIAEDLTVSFDEGELDDAKGALLGLVQEVARQALPGDRLGLVGFNTQARTLLDLTPMPQAQQALNQIIPRLETCVQPDPNGNGRLDPGEEIAPCNGTDQGLGIDEAVALHNANTDICNGVVDRLIIVVSDGEPCATSQTRVDPETGQPYTSDQLRQLALTAAANAFSEDNISVASVFYNDGVASCEPAPAGTPQQFSDSLVKGTLGRSYVTPDATGIGNGLLELLKLFRVSVVG